MYSGFVLFCSKVSQEQCLRQKQYTCADKETVPVAKIKVGSIIFLYNVDDKSLLGPFTALNEGGGEVDSGAWSMKIDEHSASDLQFPRWSYYAALPTGGLLMLVRYVMRLTELVAIPGGSAMPARRPGGHELPGNH